MYPKDEQLALLVGRALLGAGEIQRIIDLLDPLVDQTRNARLYELVGWAWNRHWFYSHDNKDLVRSEDRFRMQVRFAPDDYLGYYHLGAMFLHMGRLAESLRMLETALTLRQGLPDPEISALIAEVKQKMKEG